MLAKMMMGPYVTTVVPDSDTTLNLVLWPAQVCFCTGMIFFKDVSRKKLIILDSLMGRENR